MDLEIKGTIFGQKQFVAWEGSSNWIASAADCSRWSLHQIFDGTLLISPSNWPPPPAHTMSCLQPVPSLCLSATCCFGIYQSTVPGFWCRAVPFCPQKNTDDGGRWISRTGEPFLLMSPQFAGSYYHTLQAIKIELIITEHYRTIGRLYESNFLWPKWDPQILPAHTFWP